jgi:hypothetical protein
MKREEMFQIQASTIYRVRTLMNDLPSTITAFQNGKWTENGIYHQS